MEFLIYPSSGPGKNRQSGILVVQRQKNIFDNIIICKHNSALKNPASQLLVFFLCSKFFYNFIYISFFYVLNSGIETFSL